MLAVMLSSPVLFLSPKRPEFVTSYAGDFLTVWVNLSQASCGVSFRGHTVFKPAVACVVLQWLHGDCSDLENKPGNELFLTVMVTWRQKKNG